MFGKSSKYSCNQIAQFLEVEILFPSKFKNSLAGTFSGIIYPPWASNIIGKIIEWKTILSLPMK
jgi:hypothetical protein